MRAAPGSESSVERSPEPFASELLGVEGWGVMEDMGRDNAGLIEKGADTSHPVFDETDCLASGFLALSAALTDLELWIALANHVNTAASLDHLAIRVAGLQRSNATNDLHPMLLAG